MRRWGTRTFRTAISCLTAALGTVGCAGLQSPIADSAYIRDPIAAPAAPTPAPTPPDLPAAPEPKLKAEPVSATGTLKLDEVLQTVSQNFPLLKAIEEERSIAVGQRLITESPFDLNLRGSVTGQEGSFGNTRIDMLAEQATPYSGLTMFGGYRFGLGDYAVYNGGQKTGEGGELRAGFQLALLRDGQIDRRRAALRQAQIAERLADPIIRRTRLDFLRASARTYWAWVAAGQRSIIQQELLKLANERQADLEKLKTDGKRISDIALEDNRRAIYERKELVLAAERGFQEAALALSVFLCDAEGRPVVPGAERLPPNFLDFIVPDIGTATLESDVQAALAARPELERLRLQKEQLAVELKLAVNQFLPAVNVGAGVAQDLGFSKSSKIADPSFDSDRTNASVFLTSDLPFQRREAQGRTLATRARIAQIALNERQIQNVIRAEVQDSISNLMLARKRIDEARKERNAAVTVAADELVLVKNALSDVFFLNQRELNAAAAKIKIANLLADYFRSFADYRAAVAEELAIPKIELLPPPSEALPKPKPMK